MVKMTGTEHSCSVCEIYTLLTINIPYGQQTCKSFLLYKQKCSVSEYSAQQYI